MTANPDSLGQPQPGPPLLPAPIQPRPLRLPTVQPVFTYLFLGANILAFLASMALGNGENDTPLLFLWGWKDSARIIDGEYWRLVIPIFLHGNLLHLFFNSYALYVLGPQVERFFGYVRFVAVYFLSGIAGVLASVVFLPNTPSVGASGAIFGLIGALIVYLYQNRALFGGIGRRRLMSAVQVAAVNLLIGLSPGIDNYAHAGGLVGGAALTLALGPLFALEREFDGTQRVTDRRTQLARWWAILAGAAALVALVVLVVDARS